MLDMYAKNDDLQALINYYDSIGRSAADMKELYVQRNTLSVETLTELYRITPLNFFIDDLKSSRLTFSKISSDVFHDINENPLMGHEFFVDDDGCTLGFLENYFASCWTEDSVDSFWRWEKFAGGLQGVRLVVSAQDMLSEIMSTKDRYFMLNYWLAKVAYVPYEDIDSLYEIKDYSVFLDPLGITALRLVSTLSDHLAEEKEVRLIFTRPSNPCEYLVDNVTYSYNRCSLPFDWSKVLKKVYVSKDASDEEINSLTALLRSRTATCPVLRSEAA